MTNRPMQTVSSVALVVLLPSIAIAQPAPSRPWMWPGRDAGDAARQPARVEVRQHTGHCVWDRDAQRAVARLACDSATHAAWHHDDARADGMDRASLRVHDGTLYIATYSATASGATLSAFDLRTGSMRWRTRLQGLGPVIHSAYLNTVHVYWLDEMPVVFGWESSGRYIETVDPVTGTTRSDRRLDR